jgi:hypothetical protein
VTLRGRYSTEGQTFAMFACPDCNMFHMVPVEHRCEEFRQVVTRSGS